MHVEVQHPSTSNRFDQLPLSDWAPHAAVESASLSAQQETAHTMHAELVAHAGTDDAGGTDPPWQHICQQLVQATDSTTTTSLRCADGAQLPAKSVNYNGFTLFTKTRHVS